MSSDMLPGYWTISAQLDDMRRKLDACTPYLKDGETPAERIQREVNDNAAVLDLLAKEKEALARLRKENAALNEQIGSLQSMAHRLALDLECLLLSTDNAATTKWWAESNATLDAWRALQEQKS